jgi:hypothetical protein
VLGSFGLERFASLEALDIWWHKKYVLDVGRMPSLADCRIYDAPIANVRALGASHALRILRLDKSSHLLSLDGIGALGGLIDVSIGPSRNQLDVSEVGELKRLMFLRLIAPRGFVGVQAVRHLRQVERLVLDGPAAEVYTGEDIFELRRVRELALAGDFDNDFLRTALSLPDLSLLVMRPVGASAVEVAQKLNAQAASAQAGFQVQVGRGRLGLLRFMRGI